jgi:hypothetical protein
MPHNAPGLPTVCDRPRCSRVTSNIGHDTLLTQTRRLTTPLPWSVRQMRDLLRDASTLDHQQGQRGDNVRSRRCPSPHTPRCPRSFAIQPTKSASLCVLTGSNLGSRYEGGATPPSAGSVDPTAVDGCPLVGRRSPLEDRSRGAESYDSAKPVAAQREPFLRPGGRHARSDPAPYERAQRCQGFARSARRAGATTARP